MVDKLSDNKELVTHIEDLYVNNNSPSLPLDPQLRNETTHSRKQTSMLKDSLVFIATKIAIALQSLGTGFAAVFFALFSCCRNQEAEDRSSSEISDSMVEPEEIYEDSGKEDSEDVFHVVDLGPPPPLAQKIDQAEPDASPNENYFPK